MKTREAINTIPHIVTAGNLLAGALACIMALRGTEEVAWGLMGYQMAALCIAIAAVFDYCDGFVARLLHTVTAIGKELDSLCDCVSFGLAPAFLMFGLMRDYSPDSMWCYTTLLIPVCGAIRLAMFNVDTTQTRVFRGLPIPANAVFWIGVAFWYAKHPDVEPWWWVPFIVTFSLLMISRIKMFSLKLKNLRFKENYHAYFLAIAAVLFLSTSGVPGLAWLIIYYVLASIVTADEF